MTKLIDRYWRSESRSGRAKNMTSFLVIIIFVIVFVSSTLRNQGSYVILSYTLDRVFTLFLGFAIISFSAYSQRRHDELLESKSEPSSDSGDEYVQEISNLISCSHNLDKVRSNLRTGIIFIFGIGVALLAWFQNYGSIFGDAQAILVLGSGVLVICTIVAVLFSFSNPIVRLQLRNIGEGLVPIEMSKSEYEKTLIAIINEKESHLGKMRGVMQLGLMMFIFVVSFGFIPSLTFQAPLGVSDSFILGCLSILNFSSTMILYIGLFIAIVVIFGRAVFALGD